MNFEVFEAMYQMFWDFIYKVLAILGVELDNGLDA